MEELVNRIYKLCAPELPGGVDPQQNYHRYRAEMNIKLEIASLIESYLNPPPIEKSSR